MDYTKSLVEIHSVISEHIILQKHRLKVIRMYMGVHLLKITEHSKRVIVSKQMSSELEDVGIELCKMESLNGFFYREIVAHASNREFEEALFIKTGNVPVIIVNILKAYEELTGRLDAITAQIHSDSDKSDSSYASSLSGLIQGILNKA